MTLPDDETAAGVTPPVLIHWLHDLRNPLAAMVANLHHIRDSLGPTKVAGPTEVVSECMALCNVLERYVANLETLALQRHLRSAPGRLVWLRRATCDAGASPRLRCASLLDSTPGG